MATEAQFTKHLPNIPEEIILDILLRLPVKSLSRFRCVSRSWLFLISSRDFIRTHLKNSAEKDVYSHKRIIFGSIRLPVDLYSCFVKDAIEDCVYPRYIYPVIEEKLQVGRVPFDCPLDIKGRVFWFLGSCNGLVCLHLYGRIMMWNPSTTKLNVLPGSGTNFDCECSRIANGFGYDEIHDDYKVVEWFFNYDTGVFIRKVYSLRANSWKTVSGFPVGDLTGGYGLGKFVNGAIHWPWNNTGYPQPSTIVTHDLASDTFGELPLPDFKNEDGISTDVIMEMDIEIEVLGGCLSVCRYRNSNLDIWMMNEYGLGESWTKVVSIPFSHNRIHIFNRPTPFFVWVDGKFLINCGSSVVVYDSGNPVTLSHTTSFHLQATTYTESLISPHFVDEIVGMRLPQEIITEILLRLPVKSLLRFRCVSKRWLSLISSSRFINNHLMVSTRANTYSHKILVFATDMPMNFCTCQIDSFLDDSSNTRFLYPQTDENLLVDHIEYDVFPRNPDNDLCIVGSSNGLVCIVVSPNTVYLWNPTTRKSNELPNSGTDVGFGPHIISYGFGYDELNQDYKVVEFLSFDPCSGNSNIRVKVYSLKTCSWRTIPDRLCGKFFRGSGKFLNGSIHWLVYNYEGPSVSWAIVGQDVNKDTFDEITQPNYENDEAELELALLRGCLSICCDHHTHMDIWLMKEYNLPESWTRVVRISYSVDIRDYGYVGPWPLFLSENGKILMNYGSSLVFWSFGDEVSENRNHHSFSDCIEVEGEAYIESLVPPYFDHGLGCASSSQ